MNGNLSEQQDRRDKLYNIHAYIFIEHLSWRGWMGSMDVSEKVMIYDLFYYIFEFLHIDGSNLEFLECNFT